MKHLLFCILIASIIVLFFWKASYLQLTPSLAIYDTMQSLKSPVGTHCVGFAYNLAGFLLTAGEKVKFSLLESVLMKVFLPVPRDVLLLIWGEHLVKASQKIN